MKMKDLMRAMELIAPVSSAEEWDNPGLLVGDEEAEVRGIVLCVDATPAVADFAEKMGANVMISHHPLMFGGVKQLTEGSYEGKLLRRLIRKDLMLYAAHTNLDKAPGGVEDCLAEALGVECEWSGEPFLRCGQVGLHKAGQLVRRVRERISGQAVFYGDLDAEIDRVALSCGGGGEFFRRAHELGANVFVTGEMKHHERIEAQGLGMQVILAGHEESERVVLEPLKNRLEALLPGKTPIFIA